MALNLRRVGEVADGSVTAPKLADGAVTTPKLADSAVVSGKVADNAIVSTKIATYAIIESKIASAAITTTKLADNAVDDTKLADNSVIESKLAALAISTGKLKDNVVTLAKADDDIRANNFIGDETELSVTGSGAVSIKEFTFSRKTGVFAPQKMRTLLSSKTSTAAATAVSEIYVDGEGSPRTILYSESETYELLSDEFDISDLSLGQRHTVALKLSSTDPAETAWNDYIDVLLVK